jgi:hypothetical protein
MDSSSSLPVSGAGLISSEAFSQCLEHLAWTDDFG